MTIDIKTDKHRLTNTTTYTNKIPSVQKIPNVHETTTRCVQAVAVKLYGCHSRQHTLAKLSHFLDYSRMYS